MSMRITLEFIQETLANDTPIIVGWNDWGGHWQTIIGYDTMGTETTQGRCDHRGRFL